MKRRSLPYDKPTLNPYRPDISIIAQVHKLLKSVQQAVCGEDVKGLSKLCVHHDGIELLAYFEAAHNILQQWEMSLMWTSKDFPDEHRKSMLI